MNYCDQPDADKRIIRGKPDSWALKAYMRESNLSDYHHASPEAVEAFKDMKYGIRIHWGIYAHFQGESWILRSRSPGAKVEPGRQDVEFSGFYHNMYTSWFPAAFDAEAWAKMFIMWRTPATTTIPPPL